MSDYENASWENDHYISWIACGCPVETTGIDLSLIAIDIPITSEIANLTNIEYLNFYKN